MMGMLRKLTALPGRLRSRHIWRLGVLAVTMIVVIIGIVVIVDVVRVNRFFNDLDDVRWLRIVAICDQWEMELELSDPEDISVVVDPLKEMGFHFRPVHTCFRMIGMGAPASGEWTYLTIQTERGYARIYCPATSLIFADGIAVFELDGRGMYTVAERLYESGLLDRESPD